MRIVEIIALENGAHRNQTGAFESIPEGWAVIPEDMVCENFPFGDVKAAKIDGVATVIKWIPRSKPDPEPEPVVEPEPTAEDILNTLLGVNRYE